MSDKTSKKNKKRLKRARAFIKAFNEHKPKKALSLMSDDPVWEFPIGRRRYGTRHKGYDAVRKAIRNNFRDHPDISYEILRAYDAGETIIFEVRVRSKASGIDEQSVDILTFNDEDRIAIKRAYRKVVTR